MDALQMLLKRESALKLSEPGPSEEQLELMFQAAIRAPDHGRLRPWAFVVVPKGKREQFGDIMAQSLQRRKHDASAEMLQRERQKALRAPTIVVVAARPKSTERIPEIEQVLSAGAAAQNIMLAAYAQGFGAMWRTGDAAYDDGVKTALGLHPSDKIVGFIYLGASDGSTAPAARPATRDFVSVLPT
jgi:nitroreductase